MSRTARAARTSSAVACRALDISLSAVLLIALVPLWMTLAALIRLNSPGPVLFRQLRMGRDMRPFLVCKFRTMRHGVGHEPHRAYVVRLIAGEQPGQAARTAASKLVDDDRITSVGRLLRRLSLDELPQLWNVLRGDMSLVGPRPPILYEVEQYPPRWLGRFAVKPGLTGLWQVSGRSRVTLDEMIAMDLEYVERRSLWFNLWIIVRTVPAVLSTRGAS